MMVVAPEVDASIRHSGGGIDRGTGPIAPEECPCRCVQTIQQATNGIGSADIDPPVADNGRWINPRRGRADIEPPIIRGRVDAEWCLDVSRVVELPTEHGPIVLGGIATIRNDRMVSARVR